MYSFEKIIDEPIHGRKFYKEEEIQLLNDKLIEIHNSLNLENEDRESIINKIVGYVKQNVMYKKDYFDCFTGKTDSFDIENVKYRTSYGALVENKAMCAGYAEAIRVLLDIYGIKSYTLLSKLPLERKRLLHYVVAVEGSEKDKYLVLDPESEQYCERKGYDYIDYLENSIYVLPIDAFTNDVLGKDGAGMLAEDYIKYDGIIKTVGTKHIGKLISKMPKNNKKYKKI